MPLNPIPGTPNDDPNLLGTGAGDLITALAGNDTVFGLDGNDRIYGDDGQDELFGGNEDDRLYGGTGDDNLVAGAAGVAQSDSLLGGTGDDFLTYFALNGGAATGGGGSDVISVLWADPTAVTLDFSLPVATATQGSTTLTITGVERLNLTSGTADDTITGGGSDDFLNVGLGANTVDCGDGDDQVLYHIGSANVLDGGNGTDTLSVQALGLTALIFDARGVVSDSFGSTISNFERFDAYGGTGDDRITLSSAAEYAIGGDGDDRIVGGAGADNLAGDGGLDTLRGGTGNDRLTGGDGVDLLSGGAGSDLFVFTTASEFGDLFEDYQAGSDDILIAAAALGNALAPGATITVSGAAPAGNGPQLLVSYNAVSDLTTLRFDSNGTGPYGRSLLATFSGNVALTSDDFLIF